MPYRQISDQQIPKGSTWEGVTSIVHKAQSVIVTLLDEGYEGLSEPVGRRQMQSVAKPWHENLKQHGLIT